MIYDFSSCGEHELRHIFLILNMEYFYKDIQRACYTVLKLLRIPEDQMLKSASDRRHMMALFVHHTQGPLVFSEPTYASTSV